MSRRVHTLSRILNVVVIISMLFGSVGSSVPAARASAPTKYSEAPSPWPSTWRDPTESVSAGSGHQQIQVPLSQGSRNGLLSSQDGVTFLLPPGGQESRVVWPSSAVHLERPFYEANEVFSSSELRGQDQVPLHDFAPELSSANVTETAPSWAHTVVTPTASIQWIYTIFLPMVLRDTQGSGFVVITPSGGSFISPDGEKTIAFAPNGLPESLRIASGSHQVDARDLPINLHPFGTPFTVQAYWVSDDAPVVAIDREAQPVKEPGMAKPRPPEYRYWATVRVQLSDEDLRIVDDEWLTIARFDPTTGKWVLLPTQLDRQTGVATALTEQLGTFMLVQNMPNLPTVTASNVVSLYPEIGVGASDVTSATIIVVDDLDEPAFTGFQDSRVPGWFWRPISCDGTSCYESHAWRTWNRSTYEDPWLPTGVRCNWATWTPTLPQSGYYLAEVFIPGAEADTHGANYKIHHKGITDTVTVSQADNSGAFVNLGVFEFSADGTEYLYLDDVVVETHELEARVGFDAAFFIFGGEEPPSPEEIARLFMLGTQEGQKHIGDPVSSSTGNHVQQVELLRLPGRDGFEVVLDLFYNSLSDDEGHFGTGWSSLFDTRLKQYYDDSVMVWLPTGQAWYWQFDGSSYVGWDGVPGDLEQTDSGWKLTMPDQTAYIFQQVGWEGRLVRFEDRHRNGADLLYDGEGQLMALTDDAGRRLVFDYDGDYISQVEDPLGRTWGFGYTDSRLTSVRNPNDDTTQYTYNGDGYLETLTDPEGITYLQNFYDDQGRVVEQIDAGGSHAYWNYDDDNRVVTFNDNLSRQTTYRHDELYRLIEETDALSQTIAYEYDNDYNLTAQVDKMGRRWEYTYDDRGNRLAESGPLGWRLEYTYNETNDLTSATDALGRTTTYLWEDGNLVRLERPDGTAFTYTYDDYGQMLAASDSNGHTTRFAYDSYGNLIEVRSPLGCVTHYRHDVVGRTTGMADGNFHILYIEYDANDNVTRLTDPRGNHTTFEYDANDSLVRMVDRRGGVWTYEYEANLKLIAETDPEGHTTHHAYDEMYNRISTTDPRGNTATFRYDALYRLSEVEDALGGITRYEYDANDNLVRVVDALGQATVIEYDELNRLGRVTDPLAGVTEYEYDAVGHLVCLINPRGAETRYEYDDVDQLIHLTDALGGVTEYSYDAAGNLVALTDANDHTTYFRYDADDRLIEREDAGGHVTAYAYDCVGNLTRLTDGRGNPTVFEYDENDNLVRVTDALDGQTAYTYDQEDDRASLTDPNGNTTLFDYDLDGLLVQLTEAGGQVTTFEYDAAHNMTRLVNAKGNATTFAYDALNRLLSETDPLSYTTAYEYDPLGRLLAVTDANDIVTRYEYDPLDRLAAVVQNDQPGVPADHQTNVRTTYTYDPVGNLLTIADANGHVTTFAYDLLDRLIGETNPISDTWGYAYDPVGNLVRRTDANGDVTDYTYDADNLLVGIAYPDSSGVTFAYDAAHNQVQMTDSLGATANAYDALNRLTAATNHLGQTVGYTYDAASNRVAVTYPNGQTVRYELDANNRVSQVIDPDGGVFAAEYDATHNLTAILYLNQTRALMAYDAADRLLSVVNEQLDGGTISSFAYTLDAVGSRTHSDEYYRWRQPNEMSHDYTYDPLYRLVRSQDSEGRLTEYLYDAVGNRLQMSANYDPLRTPTDVDPYSVAYTYNAANQLLTDDHSVFGLTAYSYDGNGNRTRREGPDVWTGNFADILRTDYSYDYENRLTWVGSSRDPGDGQWQVQDETAMLYDGYGRLFRRTYDNHQGGGGQKWTEFVYDGLDPIVEYVDPSPQYASYYRGLGRILEMREHTGQASPPGAAIYLHHDGLGSVSALTRHNGNSAHTYRYWDYGMVLDNNDGAADSSNFTDPHNHYTYTGQEWEEHTRLYHFYARDYDPLAGVWLQHDPYRGRLVEPMTLHQYAYVGANPLSFVDEYGFAYEDHQDKLGLDSAFVLAQSDGALEKDEVHQASAQLKPKESLMRDLVSRNIARILMSPRGHWEYEITRLPIPVAFYTFVYRTVLEVEVGWDSHVSVDQNGQVRIGGSEFNSEFNLFANDLQVSTGSVAVSSDGNTFTYEVTHAKGNIDLKIAELRVSTRSEWTQEPGSLRFDYISNVNLMRGLLELDIGLWMLIILFGALAIL